MEITTDILVIGAGISGLSAAREAAVNDNRVMVLDKIRDYDGNNRKEYITQSALREMGIKKDDSWIVNITDGFILESYKNNKLTLDDKTAPLPQKSIIIDRNEFLKYLYNEAINCGVDVKLNADVNNIERANDKIVVHAIFDNEPYEYICKILIIAEGSSNKLAKHLNLGYDFNDENISYIIQYELENTNMDSNNITYHFADDNSLIWILPQKDNRASVGISSDKREDLEDILRDYVKTNLQLSNSNVIGCSEGILPSNNILRERTADNVIIAGSGAGFVNPLTDKGLNEALQSGTYAGVVSANQSLIEEYKRDNLNKYIIYTDMLVNDYYEIYYKTNEFIKSITPDSIDAIITQLNDAQIYECDLESLIRVLTEVSSKANLQLKDLFK